MSSKKSLIAIQGPTQFIAAYISLLWYEQSIIKERTETVLLIYDTYVPVDNELSFKDSILKLASIREWAQIVFIDGKAMSKLSFSSYSNCVSKLRSKFYYSDFDIVFIARDYGSFGTQLILNTYPNALHIEYGDSFGLVGNENVLKTSIFDFFKAPKAISKAVLKKVLFRHFPLRFDFKLSILSMPLDWKGDYLVNKNLIVPDKNFVKQVFLQLSYQIPELNSYSDELTESQNCNLYLLSNFSNSGFSTQEDELNLYYEIVIATASKDKIIILKNHPRGSDDILKLLYKKLNENYKVKIIDNKRLSFYPIELWSSLIEKCYVFPIFSSSVISLKYLFSKKVVMPLDNLKIRKYIYSDKINETIQSEAMCREAIASLNEWDGKSPLWVKKT
ncbi:hypothetical protein HQN86_16600 [Pedobacter panaciterrae]|jgi:hypothetical protein|uniref:polysialyltransferase family glycosyltransferase n=1 Tax=Pedobacter panaciterrae TaxID=363849 RepID=UPI00155DB5D3|nr:polysialyltransferase family glycosyltransferase [Pedobacter panaciterrae]NQX55244.1 hypothetical protein [Pedobacter panaciterrae]